MQTNKQRNLKTILKDMADILSDNSYSTEKYNVRKFLQCAYKIFASWKVKWNYVMEEAYDENRLWSIFQDFCRECGNGTWSLMCRANSKLVHHKAEFHNSVQKILQNRDNEKKIIELIADFTEGSSKNKITGLTPFQLTAILFASDEANFMVIDKPILEYFEYKDYRTALNNYQRIVDESRSYCKDSNLSMWHINKAYAIASNQNKLFVKKLCGRCNFTNAKDYEYQF